MEKKTDNAIVRDDTVENTDFGAEINNEMIRDNDNTEVTDTAATEEIIISLEDESVTSDEHQERADAPAMEEAAYGDDADIEEICEDIHTSVTVDTEEVYETDEADANLQIEVTDSNAVTTDEEDEEDHESVSDEVADSLSKSIILSAAEAMKKILSFTAKANAEAEADAASEDSDEMAEDNDDASVVSESDQTLFSTPDDENESNNIVDGADNEVSDDVVGNMTDDNIYEATDNAKASDATSVSEGIATAESIEDDKSSSAEAEYDEDGFILEDEFSNIPDSFLDEDIFGSDEASSLSALLYDDDDADAESDFEETGSVSFADLKLEMQKIKDNAKDLHVIEEIPEEVIEESESTEESCEIEEDDDSVEIEEEVDEQEEPVEENDTDEPEDEPDVAPERKSYLRETEKDDEGDEEGETEEEITEHIITIDRSRIRERSVPEERFIDTVFEAVELFTFTLLVVMMILSFAFKHSAVSGESMMPTFNDGDRLIISNLFYNPHRGDVVVFDDRTNEGYDDEPIIKRIIALEGDTVKIEGGTVYIKISGSEDFIVADYVNEMNTPLRDMSEITVPEGEMFVMGDNVTGSKDSRDPDVGTVKVESILGKVILRFYAVDEVESDETGEYTKNGRIVFHTNFKTKSQGE